MLRRASRSLLLVFLLSGTAHAQDPLGWNSERALQLMKRASLRRELPRGDSTLHNYQAKAKGYVYFYLDRRETNERTLVKVDQIALDLFWKRPNLTKQHIVGLRDVSPLPNRMYYHLDHLTVVQNGFGDVIRIGDGDEVSDVPHPAAPGADSIYDFRLADSVTLQLGGGQPEVRVYEIQVRPKRTNRSALIGAVFVDRAAADIVRMTFTFTPASYVDRRLDYINISLDNGLFGGQYWLPNEQNVEIRRQIPELDFAAGAVIMGRVRIADYKFNETIPDSVFFGRPVTAGPEAARKTYPFTEEIFAGVAEAGLAPPPQMRDLRERAAQLVRAHRLSGLPAWRLFVPNASSVLRHNDTEGWYAGLGATYVPNTTFRLNALGGFAFGTRQPAVSITAQFGPRDVGAIVSGYYNQPRDVGPVPGMPGGLNTLTSGFGDRDYTDTYLARGASGVVTAPTGTNWSQSFFGMVERHANPIASDTSGSYFRQPANGKALQFGVRLARRLPEVGALTWSTAASISYVHFKTEFDHTSSFMRALVNAELHASSQDAKTSLFGTAHAGANTADGPPQYDFLIGGRETLPGYGYREFSGREFASAQLELTRTVAGPWIRARVLGYAAYTPPTRERRYDIVAVNSGGLRSVVGAFAFSQPAAFHASAGFGVGLLWDVVRVDVVKGARWQTLFSVRRDFWDML